MGGSVLAAVVVTATVTAVAVAATAVTATVVTEERHGLRRRQLLRRLQLLRCGRRLLRLSRRRRPCGDALDLGHRADDAKRGPGPLAVVADLARAVRHGADHAKRGAGPLTVGGSGVGAD